MWMGAAGLTSVVVAAIALEPQFGTPLPNLLLLLFFLVSLSASLGGLKSGLASATAIAIYFLYMALVGPPFPAANADLLSAILNIFAIFAIATLLGRIKNKNTTLKLELQQSNQALEQRIEERTTKLLQTNADLQAKLKAFQQADHELQANEQQLRAIFDSAIDAIAIADDNGCYVAVNPAACQLFGLPQTDLLTRSIADFLEPHLNFQQVWQTFLQQGRETGELTLKLANGIERDVEYAAIANIQPHRHLAILRDITARKQAEREQQREQDFIAAVLNTVGTLVVVIDRKGGIVRFNQACEQTTGYRLEQVKGTPIWDLFLLPGEKASAQARFAKLLAGESPTPYENYWLGKTGNRCLIAWSNTVLYSDQGTVDYIIATGIDITEQRLAAAELKRQTQRTKVLAEVTVRIRQSLQLEEILQTTVTEIQAVLQADRVLIFQLHPSGAGTVVQEAVLPGWPIVLGQKIYDPCFQEDYVEQYRQGRVSAIADLTQANIQHCHVQLLQQFAVQANLVVPILNQEQLWGLLIAHQCHSPRQWSPGEIELLQQLGNQISIALSQAQLLGNLEEAVAERTAALTTTNQRLQQEIHERAEIETALRQSEEQIRLITDALPVLIAYVDAQQHYRFVNQAYEEWFGQPIAKIQGHPIQDLLGEATYQDIRPYIESAIAGERVTYEREILHQNGSPRYVSITYIPHLDKQNEVQGFFALMGDISDRKIVEQMKDEFVSVVSHELRTPLTSIHGSLRLLATGRLGSLLPRGQRMLEIAVNNTDRLVRLINDILDLERMDSGKTTLTKQACDAAELIVQATEIMQAMAQQETITLSTQPQSISIWADPDHILQTLVNLLSNAIKFSPPDSTVWVTVTRQNDEVLFCIQDRGRGIPANKLETIFERFQQVDASDSRKKGGTGLGLAICRNIIQQHNGRIWAESTIGEGSSFYFTLQPFKKQAHKIHDEKTHPDR